MHHATPAYAHNDPSYSTMPIEFRATRCEKKEKKIIFPSSDPDRAATPAIQYSHHG